MLHATITAVQILDVFEVRCRISEFEPGQEPVVWTGPRLTLSLEPGWEREDALSTTLDLLRLWSEVTIST